VLSETFYFLGPQRGGFLAELLSLRALTVSFVVTEHLGRTLALIQKYADVPMSLADACLVRMTEILPDPVILTTDSDFRIYRRHGRQTIPCVLPH
jgi:predicted nucleic acid-binding protein